MPGTGEYIHSNLDVWLCACYLTPLDLLPLFGSSINCRSGSLRLFTRYRHSTKIKLLASMYTRNKENLSNSASTGALIRSDVAPKWRIFHKHHTKFRTHLNIPILINCFSLTKIRTLLPKSAKPVYFLPLMERFFDFYSIFFLFHNRKKLDKICHHRLLLYCAAVNCDVTSVQELIRLE